MTKITREQVLKTISNLVDEYGEDHTAKCRYLDDSGAPVCVVGHVVSRLTPDFNLNGLGPTSLASRAFYGRTPVFEDDLAQYEREAYAELDRRYSDEALVALGVAQDVQDGTRYLVVEPGKHTWRRGLEKATTMDGVSHVNL